MNKEQITNVYQSINAVSKRVTDLGMRLNKYTDGRDDKNEQDIKDTEDALIEVDEDRLQSQADTENAIIELDEAIGTRLDDIENALCELSEE